MSMPAEMPAETQARYRRFVELGRHGDMEWLARDPSRRSEPRGLWPQGRSAVICALNYGPEGDPLASLAWPERATISVYARNRDYHELVKGRLKQLAGWMHAALRAEVKVFVDTAPVLEKPLAQAAGLGWQGKWDAGKPNLAIHALSDVQRWVEELGVRGLECHAWCTVRGNTPARELDRLAELCRQGGVRSLLLGLQRDSPGTRPSHRSFFVGDEAAAEALARGLRERVGPDFHLGLIFDQESFGLNKTKAATTKSGSPGNLLGDGGIAGIQIKVVGDQERPRANDRCPPLLWFSRPKIRLSFWINADLLLP